MKIKHKLRSIIKLDFRKVEFAFFLKRSKRVKNEMKGLKQQNAIVLFGLID